MVTKILDRLYLGDWADAQKFDGTIICVMQDILSVEPINAYWIPVIRTSKPVDDNHLIDGQDLEITGLKHQLELISELIHDNRIDGKDVLVHCMAGIERSPLTIVYYLHKYRDMSWDRAYSFVQEKRPEVANRLQWLKLSHKDRMS